MKLGAMKDALPGSLADADLVFGYGAAAARTRWAGAWPTRWRRWARSRTAFDDIDALVARHRARRPGPATMVLAMSNGGFGGMHQKLLDALARR